MEKDAAAHFRMVAVEAIADNVNRRNTWPNVASIFCNSPYLPAVLDLDVKVIVRKNHDVAHGLFKITLA